MKRRRIKNHIRRDEARVAAYARDYLRAHGVGDGESGHEAGSRACSALAFLLGRHLRLDPAWNSRERWIDGLIDGHIHRRPPDEIAVHGEMVWGLLGDTGGPQWKEPFSATVRVAKSKNKLRGYELGFGSDAPLSEKLVAPGLYYALPPETEFGEAAGEDGACPFDRLAPTFVHRFTKNPPAGRAGAGRRDG